jgi:uroporphyrinogen decarboxylase
MTSRELVIRTLNHEAVPRVPRDLWVTPDQDSPRADEIAEMNLRYPSDILKAEVAPTTVKKLSAKASKSGDYADAWGCVWSGAPSAGLPEPKHSPLADAAKIAAFRLPDELLERAHFSKVNKSCAATGRFVLGWSEIRPLDRLRQLRGSAAAIADLTRGTKEIRGLLAMLHEFACKELERWVETEVDGIAFRDDWGTPEGLVLPLEIWKDLFRPMYREYCRIVQSKDKFVLFHSGGNISDIFGDLVKAGVDAIHSELELMGVERLARRFRGRVTFWGEMDRRRLHNPGSQAEFRDAVLAVRKALDFGSGGVIAQCQWEAGVRIQSIATFFEQWLTPLPMHV